GESDSRGDEGSRVADGGRRAAGVALSVTSAGTNRKIQRRAAKGALKAEPKHVGFTKDKRAIFLSHFAATCNGRAAAEAAGDIVPRRTDVEQVRARIERTMRTLGLIAEEDEGDPSTIRSSADGPPPSAGIPPNEGVRRSLEARSAHPRLRGDREE